MKSWKKSQQRVHAATAQTANNWKAQSHATSAGCQKTVVFSTECGGHIAPAEGAGNDTVLFAGKTRRNNSGSEKL
jgi:hypothetical protein